MEFNLKQWREHGHINDSGEEEEEEEEEEDESQAKQPRLVLTPPAPAPALSLFANEPTTTHHPYPYPYPYLTADNTSSATKFPKMGGSYFSLAQWQELELQALIFRHIMAGAAIPTNLLHLINKTIHYPPLNQYYQQSLVQSGYWGKGAMDPEPGRCRRTDGKKWRCSRDVVAAQKYCERHMHRGRNRSRKPVEIPTPTPTPTSNRRPLESINETFESQNDGGRTLRRFFDDWPRSLQETDNATNLSISTPGSDFSLKLSTGNGDESKSSGVEERNRPQPQLSWGGMGWESSNRVAPMGGPLAEVLRSSISTSSPTSLCRSE